MLSCVVSAQVPLDANEVRPLLPGMMIPEINVKDQDGKEVNISADNLKKPFVLAFYRGGWCPYCNAQLAGLRKAEKELIELGFDVYFISPDKPEYLVSTLKDEELKKEIDYKLLSDPKMKVSVDFGIAFKVDDETVAKYKKWNIDLVRASGEKHHWLPAPSVFLVGTDGMIQFQYTNPNYKVRLDPYVLIAAAKSYVKNH
jgi:peroxiredoxin